jgi:hypothetical protein
MSMVGEPTPERVADLCAQGRLDAVSWRVGTPEELPASRVFRDAWRDSAGRVEVDLPKARQIYAARQRAVAARNERLAALQQPIDPRIAAAASVEDLLKIDLP